MVRAPCCDKMGLKKGPWTPQEDHILTTYINQNGHGNWRALPKQAGLMRCGKSCRLRWMNYLRPDIKRGNFTTNEEEAIIQLHQELGNKWSVIAARLPGRTDNEIKNVWNTHLKKRLLNNGHYPTVPVPMPIHVPYTEAAPEPRAPLPDPKAGEFDYNWGTSSPARSISEISSASASASASEDFSDVCATAGFLERWSEDFRAAEWSGFTSGDSVGEYGNWGGSELGLEIGNEFWNGLLLKNHSAEDFIELPEIW